MSLLACRVTNSFSDLSEVFVKISLNSEKIIFYEHSEEVSRVHVHFLVENLTVSTDTIKSWIKKGLNVEKYPATDWSFKTTWINSKTKKSSPVDYNFITYMSKGKLNPKFKKGFTETEIDNYKNSFVDYSSVSQTPKARQLKQQTISESLGKKEREKTYWSIVKDVVSICKDAETSDYRKVCGILIQYLSNTEKVVGIYKQADLVDTILIRLDQNAAHENLCEMVARRYGRR